MENIFKIMGLILFLVFAAVSLALRYKLTMYQVSGKKNKKYSRSAMNKIIRNSLIMK